MLKEELKRYSALTDTALEQYLAPQSGVPEHLCEVMRYSVMAGGKRLRPALVLGFCELFGGDKEKALPYACAFEMVHTYSLIHDDLPCIDNDDLRRGRPTCHKQFDERRALLAGDALLSYAFEIAVNAAGDNNGLRACADLAAAAGIHGMVSGQWQDVLSEGRSITNEELDYIHSNKTGAMIKGAALAGAHIAGANAQQLADTERYAGIIGLTFQISDDILDVMGDAAVLGKSTGKDEQEHKATYVTHYGLQKALQIEKQLTEQAVQIMSKYDNGAFFAELAAYIIERDK